jgi:hypothetical protein
MCMRVFVQYLTLIKAKMDSALFILLPTKLFLKDVISWTGWMSGDLVRSSDHLSLAP